MLKDIPQPELLAVTPWLRLRKYDGKYESFLPGYQDPCVYRNSEGIFDPERIPDLDYVKRMCAYLEKAGELYYIEVLEGEAYIPVGDVTVKPENPPIAIWQAAYRGKGIGTLVLQAVICRLRALGYTRITDSAVYKWNTASQRLHEKLGFCPAGTNADEILYSLDL